MDNTRAIQQPYVLFIRVPLYQSTAGRLFCDPMWAKDLRLHLEYLHDFRLCCPVIPLADGASTEALEEISHAPIRQIFPLKADQGFRQVFTHLLPNLLVVRRACRVAAYAHSEGAGWPFPLSFYLWLLRPFHRFRWIILVESSFWMLAEGEPRTPRKLLSHWLHTLLLRICVRQADATIFTQSFYRDYLLGAARPNSLIAPASWVDEGHLLSEEAIRQRGQQRAPGPLRLLFAARLIEEKGVRLLFEAIHRLEQAGTPLEICLQGEGELAQECRDFAHQPHGRVVVAYQPPVAYGPAFFQRLAQFDAVLVPNLKEEQPRILFDAFSQGIPVIAADTSGIRDLARDGDNALLFQRGEASALTHAIQRAVERPEQLMEMGVRALASAQGQTHAAMHRERMAFLARTFQLPEAEASDG